MTVNTTFLPKTNGMVFADRLQARADKGRVFLFTVAGDEPVGPPPSIGQPTVLVNGIEYNHEIAPPLTVLLDDPIPVVVTVDGDANPTYSWSSRQDAATFSAPTSSTTDVTCAQAGLATVTCSIVDNDSLEDNISVIINFYSVDAL